MKKKLEAPQSKVLNTQTPGNCPSCKSTDLCFDEPMSRWFCPAMYYYCLKCGTVIKKV
jgi:ribosomal protein S27E